MIQKNETTIKTIEQFIAVFEEAQSTAKLEPAKQKPFPKNEDFIRAAKSYKGNLCMKLRGQGADILIQPQKQGIILELQRPSMSKKITFFMVSENKIEEGYVIIEPFVAG